MKKAYLNDLKVLNEEGDFVMNPKFRYLRNNEVGDDIFESRITDEYDLVYYGDLWFFKSEPAVKLQFIFDTGSSWLWAGLDDCVGCPSVQTLPKSQLANCVQDKNITYGSGVISGKICKTKVSITDNEDQAVKDFRMIAVDNATLEGISNTNWDGIIGLLPTNISGSDLLVTSLKNQGVIDHAVFCVRYLKDGSEITFGGSDENVTFTYTSLYDHNYWSVGLRRIRYGDVVIGGEAKRGVIDTGSSLLLLPKQDFTRWFSAISRNKTCGDYNGYKGCYCDGGKSEFQDMYVLFDNYEYKISTDNYIEQITANDRQFCYFLVGQLGSFSVPTAILGDAFIRNYYIMHDMENMRVGLYGDYMVYFKSESNTIVYVIIGVCIVGVIGAAFGIYLCTRSKEKDSPDGLLEDED